MLLFHDLMKKQQPSKVNHGHSLNIIVDEVRYLVRHKVLTCVEFRGVTVPLYAPIALVTSYCLDMSTFDCLLVC